MSQTIQPSHGASSTGLSPNVAAALSYVFGFISGIVFLLVEKENQYVRFHAAQSIVFSVAMVILNIALTVVASVIGFLPAVGGLLAGLVAIVASLGLGLGGFIAWVFLIIQAANGKQWEAPLLAPYARRIQGTVQG